MQNLWSRLQSQLSEACLRQCRVETESNLSWPIAVLHGFLIDSPEYSVQALMVSVALYCLLCIVLQHSNIIFCSFLWSPYVVGQTIYIFILSFVLSIFFPRLISAVAGWMSTILPRTWCGLTVNLECRSEMCCMWLTENAGRKKWLKIHLGTITQLCRAIYSQLRHISTIGKNLLTAIYYVVACWT